MFGRPKRIPPGPGQESVWDYPRPPRIEPVSKRLRVVFSAVAIADTTRGYRVLETSHPPTYYLPPEDILMDHLKPAIGGTACEWKGRAIYYDVTIGDRVAERAAWAYPSPTDGFVQIKDYVAFYPQLLDGCYVDGERVVPQPGPFYGGWITQDIVGPFKGHRKGRGK